MARNNEQTALWQAVIVMEASPTALRGKRFCITGHLGLSRNKIVEIIESSGGQYEKVAKRAHYLISNNDWSTGSTVNPEMSSKLLESVKHGVKVITEDQFCQLIIDGDVASK